MACDNSMMLSQYREYHTQRRSRKTQRLSLDAEHEDLIRKHEENKRQREELQAQEQSEAEDGAKQHARLQNRSIEIEEEVVQIRRKIAEEEQKLCEKMAEYDELKAALALADGDEECTSPEVKSEVKSSSAGILDTDDELVSSTEASSVKNEENTATREHTSPTRTASTAPTSITGDDRASSATSNSLFRAPGPPTPTPPTTLQLLQAKCRCIVQVDDNFFEVSCNHCGANVGMKVRGSNPYLRGLEGLQRHICDMHVAVTKTDCKSSKHVNYRELGSEEIPKIISGEERIPVRKPPTGLKRKRTDSPAPISHGPAILENKEFTTTGAPVAIMTSTEEQMQRSAEEYAAEKEPNTASHLD